MTTAFTGHRVARSVAGRRAALLAGALLAFAAGAAGQFEGAVNMRTVTYDGADSTVILPTAWFRGQLFSAVVEAPDGGATNTGRFILRGDRRVMWIVMDREKQYIELPVVEPASGDSGGPVKTYTLTRTGKAGTVLGYRCEEWIADEGGGTTSRILATAELGGLYEGIVRWFDGMSLENASDRSRWEREMAAMKLFPLLVERSQEGEIVEREEVLSVDRGSVPDRTFEAPAGYVKQVLDPDFDKKLERMLRESEKGGAVDSTGGGGVPRRNDRAGGVNNGPWNRGN